jgi:hypothetical protein
MRIWDAFFRLLESCVLYLFLSKSFILLAQLSDLLGWVYRLSSAALRHSHTGKQRQHGARCYPTQDLA